MRTTPLDSWLQPSVPSRDRSQKPKIWPLKDRETSKPALARPLALARKLLFTILVSGLDSVGYAPTPRARRHLVLLRFAGWGKARKGWRLCRVSRTPDAERRVAPSAALLLTTRRSFLEVPRSAFASSCHRLIMCVLLVMRSWGSCSSLFIIR